MEKFFGFMEGLGGRALRVALGIALIFFGLGQVGGGGGRILALAGLLPLAMGVWGPCLVNLAIHRLKRS